MNFHKLRMSIMSFYAIVHQLLAAETLQIPPRRQPRKKFMLVALSLLAVRNILHWTQRCSKIRLKVAIASPPLNPQK